ncbi:MAG: AAA family ATPase [Candidatus Lokiarchaeota archaeon]|nr:AAA family ATPase [Candidatus Lokiarchaeota archaeon]
MKICAIVGKPGSGKTTAIDSIRDLGLVVTMGDIIRNEVKKRNLEPSRNNVGKMAKELRENEGPAIVAEKCVELIKLKKEEIIFVDGVRSLFEVNVFRKYWKFPIIAIVVNEKKRFKWLFERGRSDDPRNIDDLKERDQRETQFGLEEVINKADFFIENNSSVEELKKKTRKIILEIINS